MKIEEDRLERDGHVRYRSRLFRNAEVMRQLRLGRPDITDVDTNAVGEPDGALNDGARRQRLMLSRRVDVVDCRVKLRQYCDDVSGPVGHPV